MKNFCESCLIDCEWRGDVVFCDDCNELSSCNEYCMCPREEFVSHNDCYIPYEYPEIKVCLGYIQLGRIATTSSQCQVVNSF